MFRLTWLDFLRLIPETYIFIWGICLISNKIISKKFHIICCILISVEIYVVRLLPIHFGVHTIINDIFTISLLIIAGISINTAIRGTLLMTLLLLSGEFCNILLLKELNIDIENQFKIPGMESFLLLPSLFLFVLFIYFAKFLFKNWGEQPKCH